MRRKRRYPQELFNRAVAIACETSQHNAERATGITRRSIRREMQRQGVAARRPGNYTKQEIATVAERLVGL